MAATGDTWDMRATGTAPNRNTTDSRIQGSGFWVTVRNLGRGTLLWIRYTKGESLGVCRIRDTGYLAAAGWGSGESTGLERL